MKSPGEIIAWHRALIAGFTAGELDVPAVTGALQQSLGETRDGMDAGTVDATEARRVNESADKVLEMLRRHLGAGGSLAETEGKARRPLFLPGAARLVVAAPRVTTFTHGLN